MESISKLCTSVCFLSGTGRGLRSRGAERREDAVIVRRARERHRAARCQLSWPRRGRSATSARLPAAEYGEKCPAGPRGLGGRPSLLLVCRPGGGGPLPRRRRGAPTKHVQCAARAPPARAPSAPAAAASPVSAPLRWQRLSPFSIYAALRIDSTVRDHTSDTL